MALRPGIDRISLTRLRASLAVLLDPFDVHAVTEGLPDDVDIDSDSFQSAIRSAQWRLVRRRLSEAVAGASRYLDVLAKKSDSTQTLPARDSALLLALHVGAGLSAEQIARALSQSPAHISRNLLDIRLSLLNRGEHVCKIFLDELGRHRDSYVDLGLAATISRHRVRCATCHVLLGEFEELDSDLYRQVQELERRPEVTSGAERPLAQRLATAAPVAVLVAVLAGAVMVSAGLADSIIGGGGSAIYAERPDHSAGAAGWVLFGTWDGGLQVFDPDTGKRRTIHNEYYTATLDDGANHLLSPDGSRVAIFAQNDVPGLHWATRRIDIVDIYDGLVSEISWNHATESGWPTGWLNDQELLIISIPVYQGGESTERFLERLEAEGRLRALNVETGEQRKMYQGGVAQVIPSPDGTRIAMVRPRDPAHAGTTVELWGVSEGEIGELIASVEHEFTWSGGLLWSPTSDAVYLGIVSDFEDRRSEQSRDVDLQAELTRIDILRLSRDGSRDQLTTAGENLGHRVIGSDSTGEELFVVRESLDPDSSNHEILRLNTGTGEETVLPVPEGPNGGPLHHQRTENGALGYQSGFAASPDGSRSLLHLSGDYYLAPDPNHHAERPPQATYLVQYQDAGNPELTSILSSRWPVTPLRWIPPEEIEFTASPGIDYGNVVSGPERVDDVRPYAQLSEHSESSPDGVALPMVESTDGEPRPYLWFPQASTGRWMAQKTNDLAWHEDGHAMVGVTSLGDNDDQISRITLHSSSQRGGSSIDGFFDPAGLGENTDTRYASPAVSPDAGRFGYYVVDDSRGRAQLWVSDWRGETESYANMSASSRRLRASPLTLEWISNDSLLYTNVNDWQAGLPVDVTLLRLDLAPDEEVEPTELLHLEASGRDVGTSIVEFALHPNGEFLAYRQRHFTDPDDRREGYDTIHLAPESNLGQSLEIRRGDLSEGLTWAPGGEAIAIANGNRIGVYSLNSHEFAYVSGETRSAEHPVWVSDTELWFNIGRSDDAAVYRVKFGQ